MGEDLGFSDFQRNLRFGSQLAAGVVKLRGKKIRLLKCCLSSPKAKNTNISGLACWVAWVSKKSSLRFKTPGKGLKSCKGKRNRVLAKVFSPCFEHDKYWKWKRIKMTRICKVISYSYKVIRSVISWLSSVIFNGISVSEHTAWKLRRPQTPCMGMSTANKTNRIWIYAILRIACRTIYICKTRWAT